MDFQHILFLMASRIVFFVIFLTLLTFTAFGIWTIYSNKIDEQNDIRGTSLITASQSVIDMHELLTEYTFLISLHLDNLYDGRDTLVTKQQLNSIIKKMGDAVATVGTKEEKNTFISIFQGQVEEYENYTTGLKENDQQKMDIAKQSLSAQSHDFGTLFTSLIPSLPKGRGEELMNQQTVLTLTIIDAHAEKNPDKKLLLMKDANTHANIFADELSNLSEAKERL